MCGMWRPDKFYWRLLSMMLEGDEVEPSSSTHCTATVVVEANEYICWWWYFGSVYLSVCCCRLVIMVVSVFWQCKLMSVVLQINEHSDTVVRDWIPSPEGQLGSPAQPRGVIITHVVPQALLPLLSAAWWVLLHWCKCFPFPPPLLSRHIQF